MGPTRPHPAGSDWTPSRSCDRLTAFPMQAPEAAQTASTTDGDRRLVLRNTMYLGIAEVLSMPLSIALNAMIGRYLGPVDVGHIYLATTIAGLAFLVVGWGHNGSLPAAVVLDKPSSGRLLGSSIAWRAAASIVVYAIVALGCFALGFTGLQQWAIGLVFLQQTFATFNSACQDVIRGFERTDIAAFARVGVQFVSMALVIPVLVLGGKLRLTLLAQALSVLIVLYPVIRTLGPVGVGRMTWDWERVKSLTVSGTPFALFALALVLQPNIDAFYLAKLSPPEVLGWYAVSRRLLGVLLVPATALIGALYPTLCRLYATDLEGFRLTTRDSLSTVCLLVVPMALGCALYPDVGVAIFGRDAFGPAEDILLYSSPYLFLVYFSMPIGCALVASGRQRGWTVIQLLCVANSALLDPFLIEYFQDAVGNGGLGLGVAAGISELFMVVAGMIIMPRGVFGRAFAKTFALAVLSGGAMAGAAWSLRVLPSLAAAPIAVVVYGVALYGSGAISREQLSGLWKLVRRKLSRSKG